jgi:hypothetical protein
MGLICWNGFISSLLFLLFTDADPLFPFEPSSWIIGLGILVLDGLEGRCSIRFVEAFPKVVIEEKHAPRKSKMSEGDIDTSAILTAIPPEAPEDVKPSKKGRRARAVKEVDVTDTPAKSDADITKSINSSSSNIDAQDLAKEITKQGWGTDDSKTKRTRAIDSEAESPKYLVFNKEKLSLEQKKMKS